jgi:hypothetical protein
MAVKLKNYFNPYMEAAHVHHNPKLATLGIGGPGMRDAPAQACKPVHVHLGKKRSEKGLDYGKRVRDIKKRSFTTVERLGA